jgi:hypothetical protein
MYCTVLYCTVLYCTEPVTTTNVFDRLIGTPLCGVCEVLYMQLILLEVTLRSWQKARRSDVGASEEGEIASRDPTHKARLSEVGGLTLYSCDKIINQSTFC